MEADPKADVKQLLLKSERIEEKLKNAQSSLNYFNAVFKAIKNTQENKCAICCEHIADGNFTIIPCCHFYCYACLKLAMNVEKECPLCRRPVHDKELFRIKPGEISVPPNAEYSEYSSKLIAVYNYISELLKSDPSARIILFLQYKDLAQFAVESFAELWINCARVTGSVLRRQKAINEFKYSNSSRVIILSSEDSVSGMNLTEATHIIMMHPFWTDRGEEADLAYEKQGISRAHRFGLKRPLKVVRFAVKGTIEEEITLRRMNNN